SVMEPMVKALEDTGSYANVPFKNEAGDKMGTFSLVSEEPWFFMEYRRRALLALGRRLSFLVDHFTRKEREADAHRRTEDLSKKLRFLQDVSPKLYQIADLNQLHKELEKATVGFCRAVNAKYGSLYVWNEDQAQ